MSGQQRGKQVSLTVFANEPTARMAEQRLRLEGIPCLVRSLQGGPGLWGSSYNLPHDLLVYDTDEMRAREILDLVPQEIIEREGTGRQAAGRDTERPIGYPVILAVIVMVVAVLVMAVAVGRRIAE